MLNIRRLSRSSTKAMVGEIVRSSVTTGPVEELIISKLTNSINPVLLRVNNDSHKHQHHAAMRDASNIQESHFRLEVVSDIFVNKKLPERHRIIYKLLAEEFSNMGLHALQLKTLTVEESEKKRMNV